VENIFNSRIFNQQLQYFNILFISMGMMWMNALGNQWKTYWMPLRRCMSFIDDIQTNPSLLFVELITRKGGDAKDANAMKFIHLNVHPYT
jgi:hypothetical protein